MYALPVWRSGVLGGRFFAALDRREELVRHIGSQQGVLSSVLGMFRYHSEIDGALPLHRASDTVIAITSNLPRRILPRDRMIKLNSMASLRLLPNATMLPLG